MIELYVYFKTPNYMLALSSVWHLIFSFLFGGEVPTNTCLFLLPQFFYRIALPAELNQMLPVSGVS